MLTTHRWDRITQRMARFRRPQGGILLVDGDYILRDQRQPLLEEADERSRRPATAGKD